LAWVAKGPEGGRALAATVHAAVFGLVEHHHGGICVYLQPHAWSALCSAFTATINELGGDLFSPEVALMTEVLTHDRGQLPERNQDGFALSGPITALHRPFRRSRSSLDALHLWFWTNPRRGGTIHGDKTTYHTHRAATVSRFRTTVPTHGAGITILSLEFVVVISYKLGSVP
jgi:hypothetical protein